MTTATTASEPYDLDEIIDEQKIGPGFVPLILTGLLVLICDGFDLAVIGYIVPEVARDWGTTPSAFVTVLSAGIIGLMIGGPSVGFAGDRLGRLRTIVIGLAVIGVSTLITMAVETITQFVVLRFITGVALGGVIPNLVSLIAELSPRHIRGRLVVIVTLGMPLGISLPGLVAGALVPTYGWQALLLVGGLLPLAVALLSWRMLPESLRFLHREDAAGNRLRAAARKLRPDLQIPDDARFELAQAAPAKGGSARQLFAGSLLIATPLLWICQATNQMANFFAITWLPTLLQSAGATTAEAGTNSSLFAIGGLLAGVVLVFLIDRLGTVPLVVFFVVGGPLVALMVNPDLGSIGHAAVIGAAGLCVTGINFTLTALLPMIYPSAIKSLGTGGTQAAGRLGALGAPIIGGILLEANIPVRDLTIVPAAFMGIGGLAAIALAVLFIRRFGSTRVAEVS